MPEDTIAQHKIKHLTNLRNIDQEYIRQLQRLHKDAVMSGAGLALFALFAGIAIGISMAESALCRGGL